MSLLNQKQPDEAAVELDRAIAILETIQPDWSQAQALALVAPYTSRLSVEGDGTTHLDRLLAIAEAMQDEASQAHALIGIASVRAQRQEYVEAIALSDRALPLIASTPGADRQAVLIIQALGTFMSIRDRELSNAQIDALIPIAANIRNEQVRSESLRAVARAYANWSTKPPPSTSLLKAFTVIEQISSPTQQKSTLEGILSTASRISEYQNISELLERSLPIAQAMPDPEAQVEILILISASYTKIDDRERADAVAQAAMAIIETMEAKLTSTALHAEERSKIATLYSGLEQHERVAKILGDALIWADTNFSETGSATSRALSLSTSSRRGYNVTAEVLDRLFPVTEQLSNLEFRIHAQDKIAGRYAYLGDRDRAAASCRVHPRFAESGRQKLPIEISTPMLEHL
ncbi:MAG: hypothetical protein AAFY57_20605, partial [Cyanobacteria bacterium J06642_2]